MRSLLLKRRAINAISIAASVAAASFGLFWLFWILWTTFSKGMAAISPLLFTQMTPSPGDLGGGLANAIFGSVAMCLSGLAIGAPIGVAAGIYLAEYARSSRFGSIVRFINDILLSTPSIIIGLFIYSIVVATTGGFSGWAGALALAMIVLPIVVRTTDEMLRLVPTQMKEAALSLGVPIWKVNMQILVRAALPGIMTGILLALARISGETAPLLFTALNNQFWSTNMSREMASVPVTMNAFANTPDEHFNALAWAGALLVTIFVLAVSILARVLFVGKKSAND
jgi:phosphate transport system permease protein